MNSLSQNSMYPPLISLSEGAPRKRPREGDSTDTTDDRGMDQDHSPPLLLGADYVNKYPLHPNPLSESHPGIGPRCECGRPIDMTQQTCGEEGGGRGERGNACQYRSEGHEFNAYGGVPNSPEGDTWERSKNPRFPGDSRSECPDCTCCMMLFGQQACDSCGGYAGSETSSNGETEEASVGHACSECGQDMGNSESQICAACASGIQFTTDK